MKRVADKTEVINTNRRSTLTNSMIFILAGSDRADMCDTIIYKPCSYIMVRKEKKASRISNNIKRAKSLVNLSLFNSKSSEAFQRVRSKTIP